MLQCRLNRREITAQVLGDTTSVLQTLDTVVYFLNYVSKEKVAGERGRQPGKIIVPTAGGKSPFLKHSGVTVVRSPSEKISPPGPM